MLSVGTSRLYTCVAESMVDEVRADMACFRSGMGQVSAPYLHSLLLKVLDNVHEPRREPQWFNDDDNFLLAVQEMMKEKKRVLSSVHPLYAPLLEFLKDHQSKITKQSVVAIVRALQDKWIENTRGCRRRKRKVWHWRCSNTLTADIRTLPQVHQGMSFLNDIAPKLRSKQEANRVEGLKMIAAQLTKPKPPPLMSEELVSQKSLTSPSKSSQTSFTSYSSSMTPGSPSVPRGDSTRR